MKPRPKKGDRVVFDRGRGATKTGKVIAVDKVGVHYVVKSDGTLYKVGLSKVLEILLPCDTGTPEAMSR